MMEIIYESVLFQKRKIMVNKDVKKILQLNDNDIVQYVLTDDNKIYIQKKPEIVTIVYDTSIHKERRNL